MAPRRRTDPEVGRSALTKVLEAHTMEPADVRDAVRFLLEELAERAPGRSVEVRVPPYGAVQCVPGPRHTRGTPPNVVEVDPRRPAAEVVVHVVSPLGAVKFVTGSAEQQHRLPRG